jgi:hypothetical protein
MTDDEKASMLIGIGMPGFDMVEAKFISGGFQGKVPGAAGGTFEQTITQLKFLMTCWAANQTNKR